MYALLKEGFQRLKWSTRMIGFVPTSEEENFDVLTVLYS
jgi:hypothetical protein